MTKRFDFPKMWGKLGSWPGWTSLNAAQAILQRASELPQGSRIVQLGFDGGRTFIVVGWAAQAHGHNIHLIGRPSPDMMTEIWLNRAKTLFEINRVMRDYDYAPYAAEMVVAGDWNELIAEWASKVKPNGTFVLLGPAGDVALSDTHKRSVYLPGQVAIWDRQEMEVKVAVNSTNGNGSEGFVPTITKGGERNGKEEQAVKVQEDQEAERQGEKGRAD